MDINKEFEKLVEEFEKEWHDGHEPQGEHDHYEEDDVEIEEAKDVVFTIFKIKWDAPSSVARKLPKTMKIKVPSRSLSSYEDTEDYISDKISDESGYTHMGFETKPEIDDVVEDVLEVVDYNG